MNWKIKRVDGILGLTWTDTDGVKFASFPRPFWRNLHRGWREIVRVRVREDQW